MNRENVVAGAITVVLGVTVFLMANSYGDHGLTPDSIGPSLYPKLLGTVLTVLGFILIILNVKSNVRKTNETESDNEEKGLFFKKNFKVLLVIADGLFYIIALESLGYFVTTFIFILAIMVITGARSWFKIGATSVTITIVLYLIFSQLLSVLLPLGFGL